MKRINKIYVITAAIGISAVSMPILVRGAEPAAVKTVPVAEFKKHYTRLGMPETMRTTTFLGIEHNMAVIEVRRMSLIDPKKWSARRIAVKLDELDPVLRSDVELLSKIPAGADPSLLAATSRMKPFAVPEGLARRGEGPEFLLWLPPGSKAGIDLSAEKERLEVLQVDPTNGRLIPQREYLKPGGLNFLPIPDEKQGGLYWLRPVNGASGS
jgi:hypothetical protein